MNVPILMLQLIGPMVHAGLTADILQQPSAGRAAIAVENLADGVSWDNVMNKLNRPVPEMVAS